MPTRDDEFDSRSHPIQEDMPLQFKHWRMERIGWGVIGLLVCAALLGVFSDGPLSTRQVMADGAVSVQFQRFERRSAPSQLVVKAKADSDGLVRISLDGDFLGSFTIEGIQPQPESSRGHAGGLQVVLKPDAQGWVEAYFGVRPEGLGLARSRLSVNDRTFSIIQILYP